MAKKGSVLTAGEYLEVGDYLVSPNAQYIAVMQSDGNFVLYHSSDPAQLHDPYWASNTARATGAYTAVMQGDGNFVLYHGSDPAQLHDPYWASNTVKGQGQYVAVLQDDGDLILSASSATSKVGTTYWTSYPQTTVQCKFMQNYRVSSPVNGGDDVVAVRTSGGEIGLFTIGSDKDVHAFMPDSSSETGYSENILTKGLGITALAAGLNSQGKIVVFAGTLAGPALYYIVETGNSAAPWSAPTKVLGIPIPAGTTKITSMLAENIAGQLYIAVTTVTNTNKFAVSAASWGSAQPTFTSLAVGLDADPRCCFWGNTQQNVTLAAFATPKLLFQHMKDSSTTSAGITSNHKPISVASALDSNGANQTFAVLDDGNTYCLVRGPDQGGIPQYSWRPLWQADPSTEALIVPFQEVVAEADSKGAVQVFSVSQAVQAVEGDTQHYNVLYQWVAEAGSATGYASPPTPIYKSNGMYLGGVSNDEGSIEVFVVDAASHITHLFQEQESSDWAVQVVETDTASSKIEEYKSYATDVTIYDSYGATMVTTPVSIWASEETRITVNGATFFIDENRPAHIPTNSAGMLSIAQETNSLAIPSLKISVPLPFLLPTAPAIAIQPSVDVQTQLATTSGSDLMDAKLPDGSYMLDSEYRTTKTTTSLSQALEQCMGMIETPVLAATAPASGQHPGGQHPGRQHPHRFWHRSSAKASELRRLGAQRKQRHWQLSFEGHKATYRALTAHEATALIAEQQATLPGATGIFDWIRDIGDFLEGVVNEIIDVVKVVVNGVNAAITFIIDKIQYVFDTVIEFVEQAFDMVQLIFAQVKVFFQKLYEWLAWLFSWGDILRTQTAVAHTLNQFLGFLEGATAGYKTLIDANFKTLQDQVGELFARAQESVGLSTVGGYQNNAQSSLPADILSFYLHTISNNFLYNELINNIGSALIPTWLQELLGNTPASGFAHLVTNFANQVEGATADGGGLVIDAVVDFFQNLGNGSDQPFAVLLKDLFGAVEKLVQAGITGIQAVIDALLGLAQALVGQLRTSLNEAWDMPFVSQFYSWVTDGEQLTTLNLISLLVAIPTTILYKANNNSAPFPDTKTVDAFTSLFSTQMMLQTAGFPTAGLRASSAAAAPAIPIPDWAKMVLATIYLVSTYTGGAIQAALDLTVPPGPLVLPRLPSQAWLPYLGYVMTAISIGCRFEGFYTEAEWDCRKAAGISNWIYASMGIFLYFLLAILEDAWLEAGAPVSISGDTIVIVLTIYGGYSLILSSLAASYNDSDQTPEESTWRIMMCIPQLASFLRHTKVAARTGGRSLPAIAVIDFLMNTLAATFGYMTLVE